MGFPEGIPPSIQKRWDDEALATHVVAKSAAPALTSVPTPSAPSYIQQAIDFSSKLPGSREAAEDYLSRADWSKPYKPSPLYPDFSASTNYISNATPVVQRFAHAAVDFEALRRAYGSPATTSVPPVLPFPGKQPGGLTEDGRSYLAVQEMMNMDRALQNLPAFLEPAPQPRVPNLELPAANPVSPQMLDQLARIESPAANPTVPQVFDQPQTIDFPTIGSSRPQVRRLKMYRIDGGAAAGAGSGAAGVAAGVEAESRARGGIMTTPGDYELAHAAREKPNQLNTALQLQIMIRHLQTHRLSPAAASQLRRNIADLQRDLYHHGT
jgi:hypothetical protein